MHIRGTHINWLSKLRGEKREEKVVCVVASLSSSELYRNFEVGNYELSPFSSSFSLLFPSFPYGASTSIFLKPILAPTFRWWSVGPPVLDQLSTSDKEKAVQIGPIWTKLCITGTQLDRGYHSNGCLDSHC